MDFGQGKVVALYAPAKYMDASTAGPGTGLHRLIADYPFSEVITFSISDNIKPRILILLLNCVVFCPWRWRV